MATVEKKENEQEPKTQDKPVKQDRKSYDHHRCLVTTKMDRDRADYMRCTTRQNNREKEMFPKDTDVCCSTCPPKGQTEPICPGPGQKGKSNKDAMRCFTVNMVVQKLYMPGRDFECQDKLSIKVDICKGVAPCLKADRINALCLPPEPLKTFPMVGECLAKSLAEGISLAVVYMKKEIGRGCYVLPESVILRMCNTVQQVVHTANVELTCRGCTVGMATVRISMQMRCQDMKEEIDRTASGLYSESDDLKECIEKFVDQQDVFFMVGDSSQTFPSSSTDPCLGFRPDDVEQSDHRCSDPRSSLSKFRTLNMRNVNDAGILNKCCGPEGQPMKLVDMAGPYAVYGCPDADDSCLTIEPPRGPSDQFSPERQAAYGDGTTNRLCHQVSVPDLKQTLISSCRVCQVCGEDVSWLPKIGACPYCGYKPVPIFKEKPYDEEATAEKILLTHLEQPEDAACFALGSMSGCSGRSVAEDGPTSEAFDAIVRDYELLKKSIKKSAGVDLCPHTRKQPRLSIAKEAEDKRPELHLASVFAELKELFKDKSNERSPKIEEICEEACNLSRVSKKRHSGKPSHVKDKGKMLEDSCVEPKQRKKRPSRRKMPFKSKFYAMLPREREGHAARNHAHCFDGDSKVPSHMGWLWTAHPLAKKPGWRPGAIRRSIRELMRYFLKDYPVDTIPVSKYMTYYNHKPPPPADYEEKPEDLVQVPTLHIEKKNDEFIITLRPLKDTETLKRSANPYVNMKPVQFRIVKNPLLKEVRDLKRCLKSMGFSKCSCHKPVTECYCRSFIDKKRLVYQLKKECERRQIDSCEEDLVLSETTDSEAEYEFGVTPPAGLMHPERLKKSHVKHTDTQYDENDWAMPSMFPHPPNPYVQYGACVLGERKKRFDWIYGKGNVHQEPKKPIMRNKPKTKKKKAQPGRQKGGFISETLDSFAGLSQTYDQQEYSNDFTSPLSGHRMRLLNQAAYPPTAPQRLWSEGTGMGKRSEKFVRFDTYPVNYFSVGNLS
ncbi:uncharacterized protein LOC6595050 [Drosophila persimilis]|uniref:uncharacterized protein LOC6595050 n=1 Tax=Drosophila persimilis TaxID=7234 RepID=UPI000F094C56|nr:uncharacterized protein LOC6595050 [Drosophila persimilis]